MRGHRLLRRLGATMTVVLAATASIVATPLPAAATLPTWSITASSPAFPVTSSGVACPSVATCFAADQSQGGVSIVRTTTNGGASWSTVATMSTTVFLSSMTCATTTACVAIAGGGTATVTTRDGWSTFSTHTVPRQLGLDRVICTTASSCSASGSGPSGGRPWFLTSLDGGATWTVRAVPLTADAVYFAGNGLAGLTCTSRLACIFGGQIGTTGTGGRTTWYATLFRTVDGGSTWRELRLPHWIGNVASLTCAGARCAAAGGTSQQPFSGGQGVVLTSLDGGATWHPRLRTGAVQGLASIACSGPATCVALGATGYYQVTAVTTTNGGATWSQHVVAHGILTTGDDVTCPSAHRCVSTAVQPDAALSASTNAGTTWHATDAGTAAPIIGDLACPVAGTCEGVEVAARFAPPEAAPTTLARTTDGGATWTATTLSGSSGFVGGLTCPTVSFCMTTDFFAAAVFVTVDGGATWAKHGVGAGLHPQTVSCASATTCVLAAYDATSSGEVVLHTSDGGTSWSAGTLPSFPSGDVVVLEDATCASTTTCYLAGFDFTGDGSTVGVFLTTHDGGATWSSASLPGQGGSGSTDVPGPISCWSATSCVSAAENGDAMGSIPASSVAVFVTTDGGASWTEEHTIGAAIQLASNVACAAGGWCELIGTNPTTGSAYALTSTDGGVSWTASAMPSGWFVSRALACTGVDQCVTTGIESSGGTGIATLS